MNPFDQFDAAPAVKTSTPQEFAKVYGAAAERAGKELGVDPQLVLGQWGLETGWGKSVIPGTNNLGNIKDFAGGGVAATDNMTGSRDKYRAYESPDAFVDDYVSLVKRKYPDAIGAKDPMAFATALKAGGYAEDPRYVDKVVQAARMAGSTPNPVVAAVGKAVNAVVPSANAAEANPFDQFDGEATAPAAAQEAPKKGRGVAETVYRGLNQLTPLGALLNVFGSGDALTDAKNVAGGAVRGAGSIGATVLAPVDVARDALNGKGMTLESNRQRRADMDSGLQALGVDTDSALFKGGKLGAEIAGTAGVGSAVSAPLRAAAPFLGTTGGAVANRLAAATASGGMTLGNAAGSSGAGNMLARMVGGAITGGASAGLVNPEDAAVGAAVGGALPPVIAGAGRVARAAGNAYRDMATPQTVRQANKLAELIGVSPDELRTAVTQQGPQMIPGYTPTVPQILQRPEVSQLQRTLKTSGTNGIGEAERAQQQAYRDAINRVAPVDVSAQDAAARAGSAIQDYAVPARAEATNKVRAAFDAVDPFDEVRVNLPLDKMRGAKEKFLGAGTFGTGGKATEALRTAEQIGTEELPAVIPKAQPGVRKQGEDIVAAIKSLGGIKQDSPGAMALAGEVRDLKQGGAGMRAIIQNGRGQSPDTLAQAMHARGFIPDDDPATLLNALREHAAGNKVFATSSERGGAMRAGFEAAMGDAPVAERVARAVPFRELQNLRSSIGEAAEQAAAKGANKEAAALRVMVGELDARVNQAASGKVGPSEYFPKDVADQYRKALGLHAEKMQKFETGPQAGLFRKGADGQASVQGAEIPGKFYSGRRSQVDDVQSLKRLLGNREDLMDEMKRFAVTEGANTSSASGDLTSKFRAWLRARSGANRELFTEQELATLEEVGKAVKRAMDAENLGRVSGSDTAQKLASMRNLGLLDSKAVDIAANRIPLVRSVSGPVLTALRNTARQSQGNVLDQLLANPEDLAAALARRPGGNAIAEALRGALPLTYRAAPVIAAQ